MSAPRRGLILLGVWLALTVGTFWIGHALYAPPEMTPADEYARGLGFHDQDDLCAYLRLARSDPESQSPLTARGRALQSELDTAWEQAGCKEGQ